MDATVESGAPPPDSGTVTDSAMEDSNVADTNVADTGVADTNVEDTSVADTSTGAGDTGTSGDSSAVDSNAADTEVADTGAADAAEVGPSDTGTPADAADGSMADTDTAEAAADAGTTYTIGGTVTGLVAGDSFAIKDNGSDNIFISTNGAFTFPTALPTGSMYAVTVVANPVTPTSETCVVTFGTGTVAMGNVTTVDIACTINGYTLSGTVYGLTGGTSLGLQNGASSLSVNGSGTASQTFQLPGLVAPGGTYDVTVASQPAGQVCYVSNPTGTANGNISSLVVKCRTGLVAYYPFDEGSGSIMTDATGNGNNGSHNGTYVAGATPTSGTALAFNGSQGGTVTGNAAFTWGGANADYTVDYWLLTNVVATDGNWTTILHKSDPGGGNCCGGWERSPAQWFYPNSLQMHCPMSTTTNGNNAAVQCTVSPVSLSTWTHFAAVHDGVGMNELVYINGALVSTISLGDTTVGGTGIMYFASGPGGYDNLNGNLDEVRVYNRALSQAEIQADMQ
jgi:hypothetical protein